MSWQIHYAPFAGTLKDTTAGKAKILEVQNTPKSWKNNFLENVRDNGASCFTTVQSLFCANVGLLHPIGGLITNLDERINLHIQIWIENFLLEFGNEWLDNFKIVVLYEIFSETLGKSPAAG